MKTGVDKKWQRMATLLSHESENLSPEDLGMLSEEERKILAIMDRITLDCDYRHAVDIKDGVREKFHHKLFRTKDNRFFIGRNIYMIFSLVAGVALLVGIFLFNRLERRALTEKEEWIVLESRSGISELVLPDSSVVILNRGSKFSYSTLYNKTVRDVKLEGEACFHVTHNEKVPFVVKTDQVDVKVLGTVFNVSAYEEEREVVTSLISGSVDVKENRTDKHYLLDPNTSVSYNKDTREVELEPFEKEYAIGWMEGKLLFKKKSFGDICKSLERKFNCEIMIKREDLANKIFTGKFVNNETLSQIFNVIRVNVFFKYEIEGKRVIIY